MTTEEGQSINRLIFDECHELLGANAKRDISGVLSWTARYTLQRVFLTGTLPPYLEDRFIQSALFTIRPKIIRGSCIRPELAHHVLHISEKSKCMDTVVNNLVNTLRQLMKAEERMMIFVQSKSCAERLQKSLKCFIHHSSLPFTGNTQAYNLNSWLHAEHGIMVATSGLIQGLDYPDIRFVLFVDGAYGFFQFFQGSSRGGRRGQRCDVFLLCDWTTQHVGANAEIQNRNRNSQTQATGHMWNYQYNVHECRQSLITECFDGIATRCDQIADAQKCDICDPDSPMTKLGQAALDGPPIIPASLIPRCPTLTRVDSPNVSVVTGYAPHTHTSGSTIKRKLSVSHGSDEYPYYDLDWEEVSRVEKAALHGMGVDSGEPPNKRRAIADVATASISQGVSGNPSVGLPIMVNAMIVTGGDEKRLETTKTLDVIMRLLGGKCPVCWVILGRLAEVHKPFIGCTAHSGLQQMSFAYGWLEFKRVFRFADFHYCWHCGLPQEQRYNGEEPACHKKLKLFSRRNFSQSSPAQNGKVICPYADFIALSIWCIYHVEELRTAASLHFSFPSTASLHKFRTWVVEEEKTRGEYYKGLELFVWFYKRWELTGNYGTTSRMSLQRSASYSGPRNVPM